MAVRKIRIRENVNKPTINVDYDSVSSVLGAYKKVRDELRRKGYEIPEDMSAEFLSVKPRDKKEAFDVLSKYVNIRFNDMKNESLREDVDNDKMDELFNEVRNNSIASCDRTTARRFVSYLGSKHNGKLIDYDITNKGSTEIFEVKVNTDIYSIAIDDIEEGIISRY